MTTSTRLLAPTAIGTDLVLLPTISDHRPAKHVLVVEDDVDLAKLYVEILEVGGYRPTIWATAPLDIGQFASVAPDLIVLDLVLGPMADAGLALLQRLKAAPETAQVPILVCTGLVHRKEALPAEVVTQAAGVLTKPFDLDDFFTLIDGATNSSDWLTSGATEEPVRRDRTRAPPRSCGLGQASPGVTTKGPR